MGSEHLANFFLKGIQLIPSQIYWAMVIFHLESVQYLYDGTWGSVYQG